MEALRAAVLGISITGEHDPAHCLLDKACQMYESNTLKYLDLASCVSRTLEIQGTTKSRELTFEKGSLVLKNPEDKLTSATDSEIKVHYAMIRRGLASQFAKLMSHEQHCFAQGDATGICQAWHCSVVTVRQGRIWQIELHYSKHPTRCIGKLSVGSGIAPIEVRPQHCTVFGTIGKKFSTSAIQSRWSTSTNSL